ncbi:MAG: sigma-70 family RNA polymerase sigma factor [Xanthomonadales bacterium]|nr:sigma-70 family RNA polymerase sigma factor [Gammaproteobacteria bacterium]MBT8074539.1 sigma-70 family RNA polymerase sigma factor [Gammaproteobacteria bacterium]NNK05392.1 sigma-70 family RNA polymerase sigma factor [Xanthomonadales bacterium]NNK97537.1 sigma-70 family RNA polymerase sigma factor [Xanthomonadales bacterium]
MDLDQLTLAGARRGDLRACEKIYRKFHGRAFTVAVRICRCRELAQDVTQEAFISAFKRIHQFRGDAPFWGWLRRVIVNHAISALRRLPRHDAVELEDYMAPRAGDQEGLGHCMDLEQALGQLCDEDRMVVWLHDVEGYKHREIASLVGKTESYSKTRLNRARRKLRDLISGAEEAIPLNRTSNATA